MSVRDASHFCWRPSFGVCLSVLRQVFADCPVFGYICPCCVTFLLTSQFWGISVRAVSHFCWQRLFEPIAIDPRILFFKIYMSVLHHILLTAQFLGISVRAASCFCWWLWRHTNLLFMSRFILIHCPLFMSHFVLLPVHSLLSNAFYHYFIFFHFNAIMRFKKK